jgi:hypothetical protein
MYIQVEGIFKNAICLTWRKIQLIVSSIILHETCWVEVEQFDNGCTYHEGNARFALFTNFPIICEKLL